MNFITMQFCLVTMILFSFCDFGKILATEMVHDDEDMTLCRLKKARKRTASTNKKIKDIKNKTDSKTMRHAENLMYFASIVNNSDKAKDAISTLAYNKEPEKENRPEFKGNKKIQITKDFYTYKARDFNFKIDLSTAIENVKNNEISDLVVKDVSDLIDWFILIFFNCQSYEGAMTVGIKKEFEFLQLMVPELSPFIYFIMNLKNSKEEVFADESLATKIHIFNVSVIDWISIYFNIFSKEFISNKKGQWEFTLFIEKTIKDLRPIFSKFKILLADFLEIINANTELIICYRFLVKLQNLKMSTKDNFGFVFDNIFFIYFVVNIDPEGTTYLKRFMQISRFFNEEKLLNGELAYAYNFIYEIVDYEIFKRSITNYYKLLKFVKMHLFDIHKNLEGIVDFDNNMFSGKYFYYGRIYKKYSRRVYYSEFWKLLYLNFFSHIFPE